MEGGTELVSFGAGGTWERVALKSGVNWGTGQVAGFCILCDGTRLSDMGKLYRFSF